MKESKTLSDNILEKIYWTMPIISIYLLISFNANIPNYTGLFSDEIKIYNILNEIVLGILSFPFFLSILLLTHLNKKYKEENYRKKTTISYLQTYKINDFYYNFLVYFYFVFILVEGYFLFYSSGMMKGANIIDINLMTMEKAPYKDFVTTYIKSIPIINFGFFFIFLLLKPTEHIKKSLHGLLIFPFFIISFIMIVTGAIFAFSKAQTPFTESIYHIALSLLVYTLIFVIVFFIKEINRENSILDEGLYFKSLIGLFVLAFIMHYNYISPYFDFKQNNKILLVNKEYYKISQIPEITLTEPEIEEYLVEYNIGLNTKKATPYIEYMLLSNNLKSEQENARLLVAKLTLNNLKEMDKKEKVTVDYIKNELLEITTAINIIEPFILYQKSPLKYEKRTLESIIKGDYQNAVDFYLKDVVNRKEAEGLPINFAYDSFPLIYIDNYGLKHEEKVISDKSKSQKAKNNPYIEMGGAIYHQYRDKTLGHPATQYLIINLIKNNLVNFDTTKIESLELRYDFEMKLNEEFIEDSEYKVSKDDLKKWLGIFII